MNTTAKHYIRRKRPRSFYIFRRIVIVALVLAFLAGIAFLGIFFSQKAREKGVVTKLQEESVPDFVDVQIIGENCGGRTGKKLEALRNIVIHYVGNPNTTAQNNRDYFDKQSTKVSSHFVVGLDGEIIQCLPLDEMSVASNWRNKDTVSIEVCHPDESGEFTQKTYDSLIKLTAWLCHTFYLDESDVIRHHDVTGKLCPLYYVENEWAWEELKKDVGRKIDEY